MQPNAFWKACPEFTKLYIFGSGGFGREVAWLAEQSWGEKIRIEFLVDHPQYLVPEINGYPVRLLADIATGSSTRFVVAIGDPVARRRVALLCKAAQLHEVVIVHPRAELSRWVEIGCGTIICAGVIATTNIRVGEHVHINLDCTIGHDVTIGDYVTLSPGVHISGNVQIGRSVFIGTGASIINGSAGNPMVVGDGAIIGAGACVTQSVECGALVVGVPAVRKR